MNSTTENRIGFIGAGNMAFAIAAGLVKKLNPNQLYASSRTENSLANFINDLKITQTSTDNNYILAECNVVVLSVKPFILPEVLAALKPAYAALENKPLLVSVAAGVTSASIAEHIGDKKAKIARVMPNTPSQIGEGMSGVYLNTYCSNEDKQQVALIVDAIGESLFVDDEEKIHVVTGVSGSGPAYFYYFIEALINAGVSNGLSFQEAEKLALQTAKGSSMLAHQEKDVVALRKGVTSPKGTTEQGVIALQKAGIEKIVLDTVNAAKNRSIELSKN